MEQTATKREWFLNEIEELPDPLLEEVANFAHYLKLKFLHEKNPEAFFSESLLKKDWLKPQEDEAWRDL